MDCTFILQQREFFKGQLIFNLRLWIQLSLEFHDAVHVFYGGNALVWCGVKDNLSFEVVSEWFGKIKFLLVGKSQGLKDLKRGGSDDVKKEGTKYNFTYQHTCYIIWNRWPNNKRIIIVTLKLN